MPLQLVTPPAEEPVSLAEAKLHLRVDFPNEDALITALIAAARQAAETLTGRQLVTARWKLVLDSFPGPRDVYKRQALSIASLFIVFVI